MKLLELFDKPVEWKIESTSYDEAHYSFNINNIEYKVNFSEETRLYDDLIKDIKSLPNKENVKIYEVEFVTEDEDYGITGDVGYKSSQVFATVINIMKYYIRTHRNVSVLVFSAKEASRAKLYDKMIKYFSKQEDFKFNKIEARGSSYYFLLL